MVPNLEDRLGAILEPLGAGVDAIGQMPVEDDYTSPHVQIDMWHDEANSQEKLADTCRNSGRLETQRRIPELLRESRDHWHKVVDKGLDFLAGQCKDLGVLAKVIQGLARTNGAAGVAFGYRVAGGLIEQFWECFLERWQGAIAEELVPLSNLNSTLVAPLRRLAVTGEGTPYWRAQRLGDVQRELDAHTNDSPEERSKRLESHRVTASDIENFRAAVEGTNAEFYVGLVGEIEAALGGLDGFQEAIRSKLRDSEVDVAPPATSKVSGVLHEILLFVREIAGSKLPSFVPPEDTESASSSSTPPEATESAVRPKIVLGEPRDREEAFRQLEQIAAFFERTEPHSLLPAQLRRVARQGRLSPAAFFAEVIEDPQARTMMFKMVGLEPVEAQT
jgi:type VI secretion system protein ImpA